MLLSREVAWLDERSSMMPESRWCPGVAVDDDEVNESFKELDDGSVMILRDDDEDVDDGRG